MEKSFLVGKSKDGDELSILLNKANRHGVICGASGTGKSTTLKVMAEGFSNAGVPVFLADVKGDLASLCKKGEASESIETRLANLGIKDREFKDFPVKFWDVFAKNGHPIRTTIDSVGPDILAIMLGLTETQEGVLDIAFRIANDNGLKLDDLKDLRLLLQYVGDNKKEFTTKYGNITQPSIGVIQRSLLSLENQGADLFFGNPELDIFDLITFSPEDGRGTINILDAVKLFDSPDLYASFLLWLLINLYTKMPEVGDLDKPKVVFFFDEAHLLFNGIAPYRLKKIVQIVKLIRSKGIGLYFISQSITDIPDEILAQMGNRIQHGVRAYTPTELKNVKVAANSFRANSKFNTEKEITSLGTGEALISFQNEKGEPEVVEKATILPPQSSFGTIDNATRESIIKNSNIYGKYDTPVERDSAYEQLDKMLKEKIEQELEEKNKAKEEVETAKATKAEKQAKVKEDKEKAKRDKKMEKLRDRLIGNAASTIERKVLNSILKKIF